jgi:hypothetical protein
VEKFINRKRCRVTLGHYPELTARNKAFLMLGQIAMSGDPIAEKKTSTIANVSKRFINRIYTTSNNCRKNWRFSGNELVAKSSSILFSLIETCKLNKVDTFSWFKYVLTPNPKRQYIGPARTTASLQYRHLFTF